MEFARVSGLVRDWWMTGAVYAGIVTVGAASLMPNPHGTEPGSGWYGFFVAVPVFAIALILTQGCFLDSTVNLPGKANHVGKIDVVERHTLTDVDWKLVSTNDP